MKHIDRRSFLKTAGASAALAMLPPSIARALSIPANNQTGSIKDIEHIVILMQENRAFDHYFGAMKGVRGFGDRFPPLRPDGKTNFYESDGTKDITPFHLDSETVNALRVSGNPHSWMDAQDAWDQGRFGNWAKYKGFRSMGYYQRDDIPFQYALAEAFTLCDAYHCAITTGTDPNRIVFMSGSNYDPATRLAGKNSDLTNAEAFNGRCTVSGHMPSPGYTYSSGTNGQPFHWKTLFELLQDAGVTWRIFQDPNNNWGGLLHGGLAFSSFRTSTPGTPLYDNGMSSWTIAQLKAQVMDGTLPSVSWILPTPAQSEHPGGPSSAPEGAIFIETVLEALTSNPDVWSKTALFITFDENDGFFDHMAAPAVPSINLDNTMAGKSTIDITGEYFDAKGNASYNGGNTSPAYTQNIRPWGLGARVPMYVISPWSKGGWINSQTFTHTSMGMFLEQRFGITVPAISPWHRAVAGDLTSAFDFVSPNDPVFPALPDTSGYAAIVTAQLAKPAVTSPAGPVPLFQETGTSYSRATPYELHTSAVADNGIGTVKLLFSNTGTLGAVFHVYDKLHLDRLPRRYTVEAGKTLDDDAWNTNVSDFGQYDLMVLGPNGFHRTFKGSTTGLSATKPEVRVCYDVTNGAVYLSARNEGTAASTMVVKANAYRTDGPWTLSIPAGGEVEQHWPLADSGNWYDFTVTETSSGLERRFAGRLETGKDSVTDPAMAMGLS